MFAYGTKSVVLVSAGVIYDVNVLGLCKDKTLLDFVSVTRMQDTRIVPVPKHGQ